MQGSTYPTACSNHSEVWSFHCFFWGKPTVMLRDVWTFNPMPRVSESCSTSDNFCRKFVKEQRFNQILDCCIRCITCITSIATYFNILLGVYVFKCVSSTVQDFQYDIHNVYIYISNNVCIYIYTYLDIVPLHVIACSFMCRIAVLFTFMQQKNAKQMGLGKVSHGTSWRHSHPLRESKLHPLLSQAESKKGRESSGSRNEENTRS